MLDIKSYLLGKASAGGGGGGGGTYTYLTTKTYTLTDISTSDTYARDVDSFIYNSTNLPGLDTSKILYAKIRRSTAENGYFYGADCYIVPIPDVSQSVMMRYYIYNNNAITVPAYMEYGVYVSSITGGFIYIKRRYNATRSLLLDGTYTVDFYNLDLAPNQLIS